MNRVRVTKEFSFEMAHALHGYDGKCKNIHGHTYHLSVTIVGCPEQSERSPKQGMVLDFADLKRIVNHEILDLFDHALVLNANDPRIDWLKDGNTKLVVCTFQPSSENLIIEFVNRIKVVLPDNVQLHSIKLRETDSSFAEWNASDN